MAHILVIDDDSATRVLLRTILEMDGHAVVDAFDGNEGLKCLQHRLPDLVITDIFMPGRDGLSVIQQIRKYHPMVQVISVTAGVGDDCAKAKELGAARTFVKPISVPEMQKAVREVLREA